MTPREQMREQILAFGRARGMGRKPSSYFVGHIELIRAIAKAMGHKRAALLREFATHKNMSVRHARRMLPEILEAADSTHKVIDAWDRFANRAQAQALALESSVGRLDAMARTTTQNFDSLIARVTAAHRKIENQHRNLIFHHPHVWKAATQVTTDPANLEIILNAWRDAPDDDARELVIKELEEIARAK